MINLNLNITNPWSNRWSILFCKNGLLAKHTAWEFNAYQTHHVIDFNFSLSFTGDHPGVFVMLGLLGYSLELSVYDTRHEDMRC
jgi:hypothetical protein